VTISACLHRVSENVTSLSGYNFDVRESILIIFGTNVTEKAGNLKVLCLTTSRN